MNIFKLVKLIFIKPVVKVADLPLDKFIEHLRKTGTSDYDSILTVRGNKYKYVTPYIYEVVSVSKVNNKIELISEGTSYTWTDLDKWLSYAQPVIK